MAVLGAWTSMADMYTVGSMAASTTAARLAAYAKEGVNITNTNSFGRINFAAAQSDFWLQFHVWGDHLGIAAGASDTNQLFALKDTEVGTVLFQLDYDTAASDVAIEYWNGSAFVEVGVIASPFLDSTLYKIDVHCKMDNTVGVFNIYINDALIWTYTGDTIFTAATSIGTLELRTPWISTQNTVFSGIILADEDTRAMVFHQGQATANGANTAWTGVYTDVTKLDRSDSTFISSGSASDVETYVMDDVNAALAAYTPRAVVIATRVRRGGTGPQNIKGVVRQSGVDFPTANMPAPTGAYDARQAVMAVNPATSADWSVAEINAAEFGVKSAA
ncbi:hypothetical protein X727_23110 [Mesorhizobium sp. L103C119B0]|uniref:hypothetical protein n=1 Tax=Mesorhizobium sp. L103C119B0 TaxID=1287085 RepID=UPI0003CFF187|nr:hypothetical protein [Mesorhizobium sp. L103C119B0]ESZ68172.1 hypothetical protein X727_23110 [Mesorhizobium sp. L103C119B0]